MKGKPFKNFGFPNQNINTQESFTTNISNIYSNVPYTNDNSDDCSIEISWDTDDSNIEKYNNYDFSNKDDVIPNYKETQFKNEKTSSQCDLKEVPENIENEVDNKNIININKINYVSGSFKNSIKFKPFKQDIYFNQITNNDDSYRKEYSEHLKNLTNEINRFGYLLSNKSNQYKKLSEELEIERQRNCKIIKQIHELLGKMNNLPNIIKDNKIMKQKMENLNSNLNKKERENKELKEENKQLKEEKMN